MIQQGQVFKLTAKGAEQLRVALEQGARDRRMELRGVAEQVVGVPVRTSGGNRSQDAATVLPR